MGRDPETVMLGIPLAPPSEGPAPISEEELVNLLAIYRWTEVEIELACRRLLMERTP
jgi:hypothetical protein